MTEKEFSMLAMAIRTYYSKEKILANQQAMELWYQALKDIPYDVAQATLTKWVATNQWSPTIADLRANAVSVTHGDIPDWGEGWEQVLKAIRNFGTYRIEEAMNSFDGITRKCVERLGFQNICLSENINADRANFRMMYESLADRQQKENMIPVSLAKTIEQMREGRLQIETVKEGDKK